MKYLLFVCLAAAVAFLGEASRVLVRGSPAYTRIPRESAYKLTQRVNLPSRGSAAPAFSLGKTNDDLPVVNTAQSFEKYDHHEAFLGPSVGDIFGDAELTKAEVVVLVGSGLGSLMEASLHKTYGTGLQEFRDVSLAMIKAGRKVLEDRVANGIPVSEERFENLRKVEERMSAVLDALAATFDQNEHTVYSLSRFFEDFDFQPEERSRYLARVLPTISKAVFQVDDTTTAEKLRDAYNIFLPATRKFVEERIEEGKPVTEQQLAMLERAEQLMPPLMQAYVTVVHDPFLVNFMQKLKLDPAERAKYLVSGFFASMDAIFADPNASMAQMMRDVTLAYVPPTRQVFEDRLEQGKPVTQENLDNLERMEKTLPIILDAYVKMCDDLGIP
ncbi:uncharacterized protein LOC127006523 isoform X2 [Eriocheir sinensis]|uniref:uncharacterized protein LOC127006523 isoform X1 n=1 Tax=Eriocheir sinensis TaxID=95602 RepID=UPI0021C65A8E|nr:uncharacterized protein LOC127006523 isoform X1 [Eriocheir sinensis]XP_050732442.1 uncharacterized protein LOC127006523 isoform X2 [Eriocheir sinensis]